MVCNRCRWGAEGWRGSQRRPKSTQAPTFPPPGPVCGTLPPQQPASGFPRLGPPLAGSPPPTSPPPPPLAVWQRRNRWWRKAEGCGDRAPSSSPSSRHLTLRTPYSRPRLPPPLPQRRTRRRCPSGLGGGARVGARGGAGRVGGVKVGAQQNPPRGAPGGQTVSGDLLAGGRAGPRGDVGQSSPGPAGHVCHLPVEVSPHPGTRTPSAPLSRPPRGQPGPECRRPAAGFRPAPSRTGAREGGPDAWPPAPGPLIPL